MTQISLNAEQLMAEARHRVGVDIIDDDAFEPLTRMLASLNSEAKLTESGAVAHQQKLLRLLSNRLRMKRDFRAHPEIADEPIRAPVVVMGMARSGTTKTQKVLAATEDFNYLPFWKAYHPALFTGDRDESTQPRIDEAEAYCRWFARESPEHLLGHSFETHEPEEDTTLTDGALVAPSVIGFAHMPSYLGWMASQSFVPKFEYLRDNLKYLQWQGLASRRRRWLLKAPTYYGSERELLTVFPDAKLVMTHRSPLATVPSSYKLISTFRKPFSEILSDGPMLLEGFKAAMAQHLRNRSELPGLQFLDLRFEDVAGRFDEVLPLIYRFAGMDLSERARENIARWERDNPMHKQGKFTYSLAEFGLSEAQVRRDMAAYFQFLEALPAVS